MAEAFKAKACRQWLAGRRVTAAALARRMGPRLRLLVEDWPRGGLRVSGFLFE